MAVGTTDVGQPGLFQYTD